MHLVNNVREHAQNHQSIHSILTRP
jgi:hypothetical protein